MAKKRLQKKREAARCFCGTDCRTKSRTHQKSNQNCRTVKGGN